jgi:hypothetical protein
MSDDPLGETFQRFLSADRAHRWAFPTTPSPISRAGEYRATLQGRFQTWNEITGVKLVG